MQHIFQQGHANKPVLLLLHGTGGDENSLLALADMIDAEASLLSVRGNVLENGMPRFFRRLAEGVFDMDDLEKRTAELKAFIDDAANKYSFNRERVIAIGYSNGANIAANLLFNYSDALAGAILHHPMVPNRAAKLPRHDETPVFMAAGTNDPMCAPIEATDLEAILRAAGVDVELTWENFGHQLTMSEVEKAKAWYGKKFN
ncbi:MAG: alpha/beta hydrolase [Solibacillus sp.]